MVRYLFAESLNVQKNLEFFIVNKSVTADGSLLSPTGGVKGMCPAPDSHEHFTIHKWLRQTAYILTHNFNNPDRTVTNCMNTTMHTDANIAQFSARRAPSVDAHVFIHRTCGSSLALCVIPCMRTCVVLSSPVSLLLPQVLLPPLPDFQPGA